MFPRHWKTAALLILATLTIGGGDLAHADSKPFYRYPLSTLPEAETPTNLRESIKRMGPTSESSQFGAVLTKGDINGDGVDDLAVASPYYTYENRKNCGMVQIYFGGKEFFADMANPGHKADITMLGAEAGSELGTSLIFGHINSDTFADLIVGSPGSNSVYVVLGAERMSTPQTFDYYQRGADWTLRGGDQNERFGFSVDAADINGDHLDDIIVGAPFSSKDGLKRTGKVYGVYGKPSIPLFATQYLGYTAPDLLLWGSHADDRFGITLAHGDIDGDAKTDLAIGSYMATSGSSKQAGTVTILQGSKLTYRTSLELDESNSDETTLLTADRSFDWFGYGLAFGDLNRDGYDDLVISAFPYIKNNRQGGVYILWGDKSGSFEGKKLSRIVAPDEPALLGSSVGLADINQDGTLDLFIGAATGAPGSELDYGRLYVLSYFPRNKDLWDFSKIPADLTMQGRHEKDWFGNSFTVGDFDDDGTYDMVTGAPNSRDGGVTSGSIELLQGPIIPHGDVSYTLPAPSEALSRGSFMVQIVKSLNLEETNKEFIASCFENIQFCFYQFSSQTRYAALRLSPVLRLYPDVKPTDPFYKAVNLATLLGITQGFPDEPASPFHPEKPISRIHALKTLLTATGMLPWKEYFELRDELVGSLAGSATVDTRPLNRDSRDRNIDIIANQKTPYQDISARISHMWWYPRYVNFAYLSGIIDDSVYFRPDAPLTQKEFSQWMIHVKEYISRHQ